MIPQARAGAQGGDGGGRGLWHTGGVQDEGIGGVMAFRGAKIAVLRGGFVLTLQRDDLPGLPWAGWWDLPGGGREGEETPEACALRELHEELSVVLDPGTLVWRRSYPGAGRHGPLPNWFLVAEADGAEVAGIVLGDEGQDWCWMRVAEFMAAPRVIPHFRDRLGEYLAARSAEGGNGNDRG